MVFDLCPGTAWSLGQRRKSAPSHSTSYRASCLDCDECVRTAKYGPSGSTAAVYSRVYLLAAGNPRAWPVVACSQDGVGGEALVACVEAYLGKPAARLELANEFLTMVAALQQASVAHDDLLHG